MQADTEGSRVGKVYGSYQLISWRGAGSFGEVYAAEDTLRRKVAVKILRNPLTEQQKVSFLEEARKLSQLDHFHIIKLLDFGIEGTIPFLVMEYAPNNVHKIRHLQDRNQPPLPAAILPYIKQAASALQYMHEEHIIHCDIKPENLLLDNDNRLLVSDFGSAISMQNTLKGRKRTGTRGYIAPEQSRGHPLPASDQYALGVVVYQLLTGRLPRRGEYWFFLLPQLLPWHTSKLSPTVAAVIFTALRRDPQKRFPSIQAFAVAFEEACTTRGKTLP